MGRTTRGGGGQAVRTWEVRAGRRGRETRITASSSGSSWLEGVFVPRVSKRMESQNCTQLQHLDLEETRGLYSQSEHCTRWPQKRNVPNPDERKSGSLHSISFHLQFKPKVSGKKPLHQRFPLDSHFSFQRRYYNWTLRFRASGANSKLTCSQDFQL